MIKVFSQMIQLTLIVASTSLALQRSDVAEVRELFFFSFSVARLVKYE